MDAKYVLESVFQAVLGGTIQMLLERIASSDVVNYLLGKKGSDLESLVKRLEIMMSSLTGVLDDAEQRQIRDDSQVEGWLDEVQEAVFDAEDFLGEIEYEALRLKVTGDSGAGTSEVRQSKRPKIFTFSRNSEDTDLEDGIRVILNRLEEIVKIKEVLGLRETLAEKKQRPRLHSTCLVEESHVFGRDGDKEAVIKLLLPDDISGNEKISVIPIVGMGGVGKTTLAQTVFNHSRVKQKFDLMLWVCVSENYDVHRTTSALLSSSSHDACDLNSLQVRLRDKLTGKKFLIVLDDVWNEKIADWEVMRMPFKDGAQGSKIVVTTRSHVVARIAGTVPTYHLDELTPGDSWKLFAKHAFGDYIDTELEKVGREIVKKCKGLPLALKTLGGLLHSESDIEHWKGILDSEIWNQTVSQSGILSALRLSYHYLPSHLKRCFAYCAVFPKHCVIEKEELVLLWMAQNLLERPKGSMRIEEVGDRYFNVLLSMSFFQPSSTSMPNKPTFVIHDLMVDLATYVSRNYCFRLEAKIGDDIRTKETVRHLTYIANEDIICEKFNSIFKATHVRTLMPLKFLTRSPSSVSKREIHGFFSKAKKLRVLYFTRQHQQCGVPIDSICKLRHLRILMLFGLDIQHLPNSLCTLYNLQTLELVLCLSLSRLPDDFHRLINLRYLCANSTGLEELPESLSLLSNLQKLVVSECLKLIKWPKNFHNLISLRYLNVAESKLEELPESLSSLTNLQTLELQRCMIVKKLPIEFQRLVNLRYLDASRSGLEELPESLSLLSNLETLNLEGCIKLKMLPREFHHLINLRNLNVSRSGLEEVPESLSQLHNLRELNLSHCSELKKLPESFHLLTNLRSLDVDGSSVKEMPTQICKAKSLQYLTTFVVGENRGANIRELGNLQNLRGYLCINNLQNVANPEDVLEAKLKEKKHLYSLRFYWTSRQTSDEIRELEVLDNLVPHTSLVTLTIAGYGGKKFPDWLSHHSFCNIVSLTLSNCNNCEILPQLGQLPSLVRLEIRNFDAVVKVGPEFYGTSYSMLTKPFASLEDLRFYDMRNWKEWTVPDGDDVTFPKLMRLTLKKCNRLEGDLHRFFSSLTGLTISTCENLSSRYLQAIEPIPPIALNNLTVVGCNGLKLDITDCAELESFPTSGLPLSLHSLVIRNCDKLVASRSNWNLETLHNLTSFTIASYQNEDMESFPEQGLLPTALTQLSIFYIKSLTSLNNEELQRLTSLKRLSISDCPNLQTMTGEALPGSLEYLQIIRCPLLKENCERATGEYWDRIAHIPNITIY